MKKRKNGFTLIELLAVIVILAIIALIAIPIVLNIIDDTKKEAELRSADFYLDALELSIAQATLEGKNITDGVYNVLETGNLCLEYETDNKTCKKELKVEVKGEVATSGTITITSGQISDMSLIYDHKEVTKNSKGELVYVKTLDEVCEYKEGTKGEISSKYECKVDPNKDPYTFYILSYLDEDGNIITDKTNAKSVNLIMDSNIRTGGEPVKEPIESEEQKGLVAWINQGDYLTVGGKPEDWVDWNKGPVTAMNYLEEATKNWTNTNEIKTSEFTNEKGKEYTMGKTYKIYARMPIYLTESTKSEIMPNEDNSKSYLYENLSSKVYGYWTISSFSGYSGAAFVAHTSGLVNEGYGIDTSDMIGVRPVISLKLN